ncbi:MAG: hypothetical protein ACFFBD_09275, partial [Candidatus Hodarchaeota archaeon]
KLYSRVLGYLESAYDDTYITLTTFYKYTSTSWIRYGWTSYSTNYATYDGDPGTPPHNAWGCAASADYWHTSQANVDAKSHSDSSSSGYTMDQSGYYDIRTKWYINGNIANYGNAQHLRIKFIIQKYTGSSWSTIGEVEKKWISSNPSSYEYFWLYRVTIAKDTEYRICCEVETLANSAIQWHAADFSSGSYTVRLCDVKFGDL